MDDLTRYRKASPKGQYPAHYDPDDTLQRIADAWKAYRGDPYRDGVYLKVTALLDGLVNEVAPDQDPNHPNYMGEPLKDTNLSNTEMSEETALYLDGLNDDE